MGYSHMLLKDGIEKLINRDRKLNHIIIASQVCVRARREREASQWRHRNSYKMFNITFTQSYSYTSRLCVYVLYLYSVLKWYSAVSEPIYSVIWRNLLSSIEMLTMGLYWANNVWRRPWVHQQLPSPTTHDTADFIYPFSPSHEPATYCWLSWTHWVYKSMAEKWIMPQDRLRSFCFVMYFDYVGLWMLREANYIPNSLKRFCTSRKMFQTRTNIFWRETRCYCWKINCWWSWAKNCIAGEEV